MRVGLAAGHRNYTGGNAYERETTGLLTPRIARALRALGIEVRVVQPLDGAGEFAGTLGAVVAQFRLWARQGWTPDVILETHTEGVQTTSKRGIFVIYPEWPVHGDVDVAVRDTLGPRLCQLVHEHTGMPIWRDGLMSERATYVGSQGDRLAMFGGTRELAPTTTRLLVEYGAHSNPDDARLHRDARWLDGAAEATALALAEFGGALSASTAPVNRVQFTETSHWLALGFKAYWEANGGLPVFGLPLSEELTEDGRTVQYFERAVFEYHPSDPVQPIKLRRLGATAAKAAGLSGPGIDP